MAFLVGDQPGEGRYCCTSCGWSVELETPFERLPPCQGCDEGADAEYEAC